MYLAAIIYSSQLTAYTTDNLQKQTLWSLFASYGAASPVFWFRQSKRTSCQRWKPKVCEEVGPAAADHKLRGSHCTQTTVSSHHSRRPRGLECACERGAYFVFFCPDRHPLRHLSSIDVLFSIFSPSICERWKYQGAVDWKNLRVA